MSDHYEIVISCFLGADTPDHVLDELRWHLGSVERRPAHLDEETAPYPLLYPDPEGRLPGGDVARLRLHRNATAADGRHEWGLYVRTCFVDDEMGEVGTVLDLIAPYVSGEGPRYGGGVRDILNGDLPGIITFADGGYAIGRW
ncbi:hypothetical protein [Actinoplanes regularis]|uniref:hypothetical protein n=1 Tax=Actinoplanes regularis TaxID=52697 RepID=UPI0024A4A2FF|nr:hypothetical protein [Actinoplanes regularis]GLW35430.1 hypothetical protein Areg01_83660 [Actinoplanes regularis]